MRTQIDRRRSPIIIVVEGAGGARSPIADDGDTVALAHALAADRVVVVADAGLGTINAVRLTVAALSSWTPVVALNRYDDGDALHRRQPRVARRSRRLHVW